MGQTERERLAAELAVAVLAKDWVRVNELSRRLQAMETPRTGNVVGLEARRRAKR